jgi:hypothetical protein
MNFVGRMMMKVGQWEGVKGSAFSSLLCKAIQFFSCLCKCYINFMVQYYADVVSSIPADGKNLGVLGPKVYHEVSKSNGVEDNWRMAMSFYNRAAVKNKGLEGKKKVESIC